MVNESRASELISSVNVDSPTHLDLSNKIALNRAFKKIKIDYVVNLAAQAGVRYSIKNPHTYVNSNILGFVNLISFFGNISFSKHG